MKAGRGVTARNPLRERIFYVKLDRVLVPLAMSGIEEILRGTHPSLEGLENVAKARIQIQAMAEVLGHMPKRIEDKMDAREIAEISRRPGVIIFPMQPKETLEVKKVLNQAEIIERVGLEEEDLAPEEEMTG